VIGVADLPGTPVEINAVAVIDRPRATYSSTPVPMWVPTTSGDAHRFMWPRGAGVAK